MPSSTLAGAPARKLFPRHAPRPPREESGPAAQDSNRDLEQQSDEMLGRAAMPGVDGCIYTEVALLRKIRDERKRLKPVSEEGIDEEIIGYLVDRQVEELIDAAGLSAIQEIVYRLYAAGLSVRRISVVLGVRRRTIEERLRTIKRRVRRAYNDGPYAGWYEVYLSEVNRPAYRRGH